MNEFAPSVLEHICEGLGVADVRKEGRRDEGERNAPRRPLVDGRQQEAEGKAVNDSRNHVLRLQPLGPEFVDVLSELLLSSD